MQKSSNLFMSPYPHSALALKYQLKFGKAPAILMRNVFNRIYFYFCNLDSKDAIIKLTSHKDCQAVISKIREKDM